MPNHVTNKLIVRGDATRVAAFLAQSAYASPTKKFSFRGFIPPPNHPDYDTGGCSHPHAYRDGEHEPNPNCWYVWNRLHWGTKWDCYDVKVSLQGEGLAEVRFDTAWSPPRPVVLKIAETFYDLDIDHTWMDEDTHGAGGGFLKFRGGKVVARRERINDPLDPDFGPLASDLKDWKPEDDDAEDDAEDEE